MVKKQQSAKPAVKTLLSILLILSGAITDTVDIIFNLSDDTWAYWFLINKDLQIIGFAIIAYTFISFQYIRTKAIFLLLLLWKLSVLNINLFQVDRVYSLYTIGTLSVFYILWIIRIALSRKIQDKEPGKNEAHYIFLPVFTIWGLLQALFLPWHPALYEARMISDGHSIWSVYKKYFTVTGIEFAEIDYNKAIRIPMGQYLTEKHYKKLNALIGQRCIAGLKDCRKLLIVGKVW